MPTSLYHAASPVVCVDGLIELSPPQLTMWVGAHDAELIKQKRDTLKRYSYLLDPYIYSILSID